MKRRIIFYIISLVLLLALWFLSIDRKSSDIFSEKVKISLREVGDQLLREHLDSTSRVLPITEDDPTLFRLSFQNNLGFYPESLVAAIDSSFRSRQLSENYLVEVIQCADKEVAYSFEVDTGVERTVIACAERKLPPACYTITVRFADRKVAKTASSIWIYLLLFFGIIGLIELYFNRNQTGPLIADGIDQYTTLGSFRFYPNQNILVKQATEISLSKKEGELLAIFVANPNKVVKRDELTKKVWEDKGVIVGRSLDTYISKLRKKLQEDESIKIVNVHGVGYKLEVE
ncbi:MAG: winged helix family transcriptional regulator [Flavobacterium sp.]|nr:MAG: winged helix family transcriptional regulator [Flavobacterium sp.]